VAHTQRTGRLRSRASLARLCMIGRGKKCWSRASRLSAESCGPALAALARRGMDAGNIVRLYPALEQAAVVEAIDPEDQLARNLSVPLAA
jgi:hypothetical protein